MVEDASAVLVVEPDPAIRRLITLTFASAVLRVANLAPEESVEGAIAGARASAIVVNVGDAGEGGIALLRELQAATAAKILALTASTSGASVHDCLRHGAFDVLLMPFDPDDLELAVQLALGFEAPFAAGPPPATAHPLALTEWRILRLLGAAQGEPVLHRELLGKLWGQAFRDDRDLLQYWLDRLGKRVPLVDYHGVGCAWQGGIE